jgi:phospholipid transport system substrate-binding protein
MKFVLIITILLTFLTATSVVSAQGSGEIQKLLDQRDKQIKMLVGPEGTKHTDSQREQLKDIINGIIDYDAMAKVALQETYSTITQDQRAEFVELFSTIIRNQSLNKLDIYRAQVSYNNITVNGNSAVVSTTATLDNIRTPVSYTMEKRNNTWFITDMAIDNVSTAESYRRSFQNVIRRRGFDALMDTVRKRAAN